jgi:hypothetical protein
MRAWLVPDCGTTDAPAATGAASAGSALDGMPLEVLTMGTLRDSVHPRSKPHGFELTSGVSLTHVRAHRGAPSVKLRGRPPTPRSYCT